MPKKFSLPLLPVQHDKAKNDFIPLDFFANSPARFSVSRLGHEKLVSCVGICANIFAHTRGLRRKRKIHQRKNAPKKKAKRSCVSCVLREMSYGAFYTRKKSKIIMLQSMR
jgi:hypothetical protein